MTSKFEVKDIKVTNGQSGENGWKNLNCPRFLSVAVR